MYSNIAYFGHGYYGLQAASCGYFAVPSAALTWPQAALLAGLLQAPSADDPLAHLPLARAREAHVLGRLTVMETLTRRGAAASSPNSSVHCELSGRSPGGCVSI